jgi:hypothetical protein
MDILTQRVLSWIKLIRKIRVWSKMRISHSPVLNINMLPWKMINCELITVGKIEVKIERKINFNYSD